MHSKTTINIIKYLFTYQVMWPLPSRVRLDSARQRSHKLYVNKYFKCLKLRLVLMSYNRRYSEARICVISISLSVKRLNIIVPDVLIFSLYQGGNFIFTLVMAYKLKGSPRALVPVLISLKHYFKCIGISKIIRFRSTTKLRSALNMTFLHGVQLTLLVLSCIWWDRQTQRYTNFSWF
jgi:hypothetical protein